MSRRKRVKNAGDRRQPANPTSGVIVEIPSAATSLVLLPELHGERSSAIFADLKPTSEADEVLLYLCDALEQEGRRWGLPEMELLDQAMALRGDRKDRQAACSYFAEKFEERGIASDLRLWVEAFACGGRLPSEAERLHEAAFQARLARGSELLLGKGRREVFTAASGEKYTVFCPGKSASKAVPELRKWKGSKGDVGGFKLGVPAENVLSAASRTRVVTLIDGRQMDVRVITPGFAHIPKELVFDGPPGGVVVFDPSGEFDKLVQSVPSKGGDRNEQEGRIAKEPVTAPGINVGEDFAVVAARAEEALADLATKLQTDIDRARRFFPREKQDQEELIARVARAMKAGVEISVDGRPVSRLKIQDGDNLIWQVSGTARSFRVHPASVEGARPEVTQSPDGPACT